MLRSASVWTVVLLWLAGCAGGQKPSSVTADTASEEAAAAGKDLQVEVVSQGFRDANIYLRIGGSRQRLGLAGGNATSSFKVKWNAQLANALDVSLLAERIGDEERAESSSIQLVEGARIVWKLGSQFSEMSLEVY